MAASERGYDPTDVKSIVEYSRKLVGKTLREVTDAPELADPHRRRGSFGNAVEEYFFSESSESCGSYTYLELR